jgi:signal peptidase I
MIRRILDVASWLAISAICIMAAVVAVGLALGFRPIAITTGSMDPWAPPGALVVAGPTDATDIAPGDVLVMRKPGGATVTHRVIDLLSQRGQLLAVTQGDANEDPDPTLYLIGERELTGRASVPGGGRLLVAIDYRFVLLVVVTGTLITLALMGLRRIWSDDVGGGDSGDSGGDDESVGIELSREPDGKNPTPNRRRRASALPVACALLTLLMAETSLALYTATATVPSNTFATLGCVGTGGVTVYSGSVIQRTDGPQTATIPAVDPTRAFLLFSSRSSDGDVSDAVARGELTNATTVTFHRDTSRRRPPRIDIQWSVVEYACGVGVQRGTASPSGSSSGDTVLDVPIATVDPSSSFALTSVQGVADNTLFDAKDMVQAEVVSSSVLRLTSHNFVPTSTYGWQVITFDEPGAASVEIVSTTLDVGVGSSTITLPTPVDVTKTFLIAGPISTSTAVEVGEQMVMVALTAQSTVEVERQLATEAIDVSIQVITLNDGTVVTHGVTDLANKRRGTVAVLPGVDDSIAVAVSTVNAPGSMSGGSTNGQGNEPVGGGSATFKVTGSTSLRLRRNASNGPARFGWQVIEWAK